MRTRPYLFAFAFFMFFFHILPVSPAGAVNKIMPLGDSITWDDRNNDPRSDGEKVSYRYRLWQLLTDAGYEIDFVGSQNTGYDIFPEAENEGHPGWRDDQIVNGRPLTDPDAGNLTIWLTDEQPRIVLLHIGTNVLDDSPDDVEAILDEIDAYSLNAWVVLARIINRNCITDLPESCSESVTTMNFNINVANMAEARISTGDKIIIVDMENGAGIDYHLTTDDPPGDMWNNLHPFVTGYEKMGELWFSGLMQIMPQADAGPDQIVNASAPVTLDAGGSFDPEGGDLSYKWVQTAGIPVVDLLPDDQAVMPTFGTPEVVGPEGELLIFKATVSDPDGLESTDAISVTVLNCPGDFDLDNDVDAFDLGEYVNGRGGLNLNGFIADFGKVNCQ